VFIYDPVKDERRVATEAEIRDIERDRRWTHWGGDLVYMSSAAHAILGGTNSQHLSNAVHSVQVYTPPPPARCTYCSSKVHGDRCDSCGAPT
jgi:hypothetical protein